MRIGAGSASPRRTLKLKTTPRARRAAHRHHGALSRPRSRAGSRSARRAARGPRPTRPRRRPPRKATGQSPQENAKQPGAPRRERFPRSTHQPHRICPRNRPSSRPPPGSSTACAKNMPATQTMPRPPHNRRSRAACPVFSTASVEVATKTPVLKTPVLSMPRTARSPTPRQKVSRCPHSVRTTSVII